MRQHGERYPCTQGSPEWYAFRRGKVTASRMSDVLAGGKGVTRENYMLQLLNERMTNKNTEEFESFDMRKGMALEPEAFDKYEFIGGVDLDLVGFTDHPTVKMSGASTDRLVRGLPRIAQAKCPKFTTHLKTILGEPIAREYLLQMQWEMACEGAEDGIFISYCPDVADELQVFHKLIPRDDVVIAMLEEAVNKFNEELEAKMALLKAA